MRIEYINLTEPELKKLKNKQSPIDKIDDKRILARYPKDGNPLFQNKAIHVYNLVA